MAPMQPPELLTADQAAAIAGVNRRTITKWADSGRLPAAMRLPGDTGARLFAAAEVDRVAAEYAASLSPEEVGS